MQLIWDFTTEKGTLPRKVKHVRVPPIKLQGIKTKLVPEILGSVKWDGTGRWIEPFVGSGVVVFNLAPKRALLADTNVHIIRFYQDLANGVVTPELVRDYLETEGEALRKNGEDHYYYIRERFNKSPSSLDFLFLNRACFNGVLRFNKRGEFNVPFCRKPDRFRAAYVTKIVNQVTWVSQLINTRDWVFQVADWKDTLAKAQTGDFVYADPPYAGRHTDYYNSWTDEDAIALGDALLKLPCGFALSTWKRNQYRSNPHLESVPDEVVVKGINHFYHVGSKEAYRNEMEEALVIRRDVACIS